MDFSEDEMLFDPDVTHDNGKPLIADNDGQQLQEGCDTVAKRGRKRPCATQQSSSPSDGPGRSDLHSGLPSPVSPDEVKDTTVSDALAPPRGKRDRQWLIGRIEYIFEQQVDGILAGSDDLSVTVKLRPRNAQAQHQAPVIRQFKFPGRSEKDAWRYTVIIRILELIYTALVSDNVITKRDIYYRDPKLFSKQEVVDRFVDDLAFTFGVPRMLMNVTATAKGLIAGNFKICRGDVSVTDGRSEREGLLTTPLKDDETININHVKWVVVVEKEATFRSLVSSPFWDRLSARGLLVTAKGYPDIATRLCLRSIAEPTVMNHHQSPPIYGLMDFDPDGIDILSTYKHGSAALAHEKSDHELPMIQWLGLSSKDIGSREDLHESQGLLTLSERDRRKATRMLERESFRHEHEWRREVQVMLMLNVKAEIQLLEARKGGLSGWLLEKGIV